VQALVDQRVLLPQNEGLDEQRVPVVGKPATHGFLLSVIITPVKKNASFITLVLCCASLISPEKTRFFSSIKSIKMVQRASQGASKESIAALMPPEKSARLACALDGYLTTSLAISGQK
jgi:hypothetical protein